MKKTENINQPLRDQNSSKSEQIFSIGETHIEVQEESLRFNTSLPLLGSQSSFKITTPARSSPILSSALANNQGKIFIYNGQAVKKTDQFKNVVDINFLNITPIRPKARILKLGNLHPFTLNSHLSNLGETKTQSIPKNEDPIHSGDFLLWPESRLKKVFFSTSKPQLETFSCTIFNQRNGNSLAFSRATVNLRLSLYTYANLETSNRFQEDWIASLKQFGLNTGRWNFEPLIINNIQANIVLPNGFISEGSNPIVNFNSHLGIADFMFELSDLGTNQLQNALETNRPDSIGGLVEFEIKYMARSDKGPKMKRYQIKKGLNSILENVNEESIRTLNPEVDIESLILVEGNETLDNVIVHWKPNEGGVIQTESFGREGGERSNIISTTKINDIEIEWSAIVNYKPEGWPTIHIGGKERIEDNSWTVRIDPRAWLHTFNIFPMRSNPVNSDELRDIDINGELRIEGDYLENGRAVIPIQINQTEVLTQIRLPIPPGETPNSIRLTLLNERGMKVRELSIDDSYILALLGPNNELTIETNQDVNTEANRDDSSNFQKLYSILSSVVE